jgi:hypothetical protein
MTANNLISLIDKEYPNQWSNETKIAWINEAMFQLYTYMTDSFKRKAEIYTVKGECLYGLPKDCRLENIERVEMSPVPGVFYWLKYDSDRQSGYYDGLNNRIGIAPIPDKDDMVIKITYNSRPGKVENVTDTIDVDEDFVHVIKYFVLGKCASSGNKPDTNAANNFNAMYNDTLNRMMKVRGERQTKTPKKNRCNPWW